MKKGLTEIVFLLDESGSMNKIKSDAMGGFNAFIEDQKKQPGEAVFTLVLFDDKHYIKQFALDINLIEPLTEKNYFPCGGTAYFDALGHIINLIGERLAAMPECERPENVVVTIMTDGEENSSGIFSAAQIKDMIKHQEEVYNWHFVFLAANQDAFEAASNIGINNYSNFVCTSDGVFNTYNTYSIGISELRCKGTMTKMPENIDG